MAPDNQPWKGVTGNLTSYGDDGFSRYIRRVFFAAAGLDEYDFNKPVVGILSTCSDYTPCHRDMPALVEAVKRGVTQAGALPLECPTLSLGETIISPTSMLYRNLLAMETEEAMRAYPMDAAVLIGGCDKTLPAQIMAALSVNIPVVSVVTGPMRTGQWQGNRIGACTDCRSLWSDYRAGTIAEDCLPELEKALCTTGGTCMVMGTASTMSCVVETLGLMLPMGATAPNASGDRLRNAVASGRVAAQLTRDPIRPRDLVTLKSLENATRCLVALGGSTNAIIHLLAIARRASISFSIDDIARIADETPLLANCRPSGEYWLEDMHHAGGVPVLLKSLESVLHMSTLTIEGTPLKERLISTPDPPAWQNVLSTMAQPMGATGSLTVLKGTLAPQGAVIKASATTPALCQHKGPAVVFDSLQEVSERIDDPALAITPDHVLVLRNAGPVGSGMPEAGSLPIPRYLAEQGVKDMVRVSDARMSGTAFGTVVLHCSPEAAVGGPLSLVKTGDLIELDLADKKINLIVDETILRDRRSSWRKPDVPQRGWQRLYAQHVEQAHLGADLDFLV